MRRVLGTQFSKKICTPRFTTVELLYDSRVGRGLTSQAMGKYFMAECRAYGVQP